MTIDQAIIALTQAKAKIGGDKTIWVNNGGNQCKWEEIKVVSAQTLRDGESTYLQLTAVPEDRNED